MTHCDRLLRGYWLPVAQHATAPRRGHPDMNSLIGLGAATSFLAGGASLLLPDVGLQPSFLEEPVMLLAIVLLGRSLEARARLKASGGQVLRVQSLRAEFVCAIASGAGSCARGGLVVHLSAMRGPTPTPCVDLLRRHPLVQRLRKHERQQ